MTMNEEDIIASIERQAMNTVGYAEADNKESFLVGLRIGAGFAFKHLNREIKAVEERLRISNDKYIEVATDISTLANIIEKYLEK